MYYWDHVSRKMMSSTLGSLGWQCEAINDKDKGDKTKHKTHAMIFNIKQNIFAFFYFYFFKVVPVTLVTARLSTRMWHFRQTHITMINNHSMQNYYFFSTWKRQLALHVEGQVSVLQHPAALRHPAALAGTFVFRSWSMRALSICIVLYSKCHALNLINITLKYNNFLCLIIKFS